MPLKSLDFCVPGYTQTALQSLSQEEADRIIRTISYHREEACRSTLWFGPDQQQALLESVADCSQRNSALGHLSKLPNELLANFIIPDLDIESIFKFRQTSLFARQALQAIPAYQRMVSHGMQAVCALLKTPQLARLVTLAQFDEALCTKECDICGDFAGIIFLPTWTRCCFKCLGEHHEFDVQPVEGHEFTFHLNAEELKQLESSFAFTAMKPLDVEVWGPDSKSTRPSLDRGKKDNLLVASTQQVANMLKAPQRRRFPKYDLGREKFSFWMAKRRKLPQHPRFGVTRTMPLMTLDTKLLSSRNAFACVLPWFDTTTRRAESGLLCAGCQPEWDRIHINQQRYKRRHRQSAPVARRAAHKAYSRDKLLKHLAVCPDAQQLLEDAKATRNLAATSQSKTKAQLQLPHLPQIARDNNYFSSDEHDKLGCGCQLPW